MRRAAALLVATACATGNGDVEPPAPATLVREGARPAITRTGDLDGDGTPEVVVSSVSEAPGDFGLPAPYLEVFAHRDGNWRRVFDATGHAPEGEGAPEAMLELASGEFAVGQAVEVLELVDLAHDGASEIVAAISNAGATAGPLELWIVSMSRDGGLRTEHYQRTERGGKVAIVGDRVGIEFAVYRKDDPGCCPSSFEIQMIGYDAEQDAIRVLERERHALKTPEDLPSP